MSIQRNDRYPAPLCFIHWDEQSRRDTSRPDSKSPIPLCQGDCCYQDGYSDRYHQLYAQAKYLILHGERYYLNDEDEALIRQANEEFEVQIPIEHLFHSAFSVPSDTLDGEWLTTPQILEKLSTLPTYNKKTDCSVVKLGRVLTLCPRHSGYTASESI